MNESLIGLILDETDSILMASHDEGILLSAVRIRQAARHITPEVVEVEVHTGRPPHPTHDESPPPDSQAVMFPPKRKMKGSPNEVPCPRCGAPAGSLCYMLTTMGKPIKPLRPKQAGHHNERRRAVRS